MLNITHYQRSANQNHNEVRQSEWLLSKSLQTTNGDGVEKKEPSYTVGVGGDAN